MNLKEKIYKVSFINQGKIYDIFAKGVHQSGLLGFIEVEEIVFGEKSSVVVDPSEESLKTEFSGGKYWSKRVAQRGQGFCLHSAGWS